MTRLFEELTDENFELYAARHYDNPACVDISEFREDLARFKYVKRLARNYLKTGIVQERLLLNHVVVLLNVFGKTAAMRMIFHKMEPELWPILKPFLIASNAMTANDHPEIPMDLRIVAKLRNI